MIKRFLPSYLVPLRVFYMTAFGVLVLLFFDSKALNKPNQYPIEPCQTNHTGDICFKNTSTKKVTINMDGGGFDAESPISIESGEIGCFYELKAGKHSWSSRIGYDVSSSKSGNCRVIECKSDTIFIK